MEFAEYLACDATALAQHVARGDVAASALLDLALAQNRRRVRNCLLARLLDRLVVSPF
jgi:hypothetical protein